MEYQSQVRDDSYRTAPESDADVPRGSLIDAPSKQTKKLTPTKNEQYMTLYLVFLHSSLQYTSNTHKNSQYMTLVFHSSLQYTSNIVQNGQYMTLISFFFTAPFNIRQIPHPQTASTI